MKQTVQRYAAFLPEDVRSAMRPPTSSWWLWRDTDVHLLRDRRPAAPVKMLAVHGAATHSAALYPMVSLAGFDGELVIPDLPLYGKTQVPHPTKVRYQDWVDLLCELVRAEDDGRPLVLLGTGTGGMLAYEVAARTGRAAALVVTSLTDPADPRVLARLRASYRIGCRAHRLLRLLRPWVDRVRVPSVLPAEGQVRSLSCGGAGGPVLRAVHRADPLGGGAGVPLGFLTTWASYRNIRPERFTGPQILLLQPDGDHPDDLAASEAFLGRVAAPTTSVRLLDCEAFTVGRSGIDQMRAAVGGLVDRVRAARPPTVVDLRCHPHATRERWLLPYSV